MRDDFTREVKLALAHRVGLRCSHPDCQAATSGPQDDPAKAVNIGVAAHITAAAPEGPRYDASLTSEQRQDITNGIWLCQNHAKLVDNDPAHFPVDLLRAWKVLAEHRALERVGRAAAENVGARAGVRIVLPAPVNQVGHSGITYTWSVRVRLIAEGDRPLDIVELGLTEEDVGPWTIDEVFREGSGKRVVFPIRLQPSDEFWIRARSPQPFEIKPPSVGRLTLWVRDHTQRDDERHEHVIPPI